MKYDVAVIGAGPAGMMATGIAGLNKARVILIEKNHQPGVKLLITGKGRCNITNQTEELKTLIDKYGKNGRFLYSAFNKFGVQDTIEFFENKGLKTKVERGNRVFPVSDNANDVLDVLMKFLEKSQVEIKTNGEVKKIISKNNEIKKIILKNNLEIIADKYIICTGGKSYPKTGSTGDAYKWLTDLGHKVVKPKPSLTPIIVKQKVVKQLEGLSLKNVEISIYKNNKKIDSRFGETIFTSNGLSGPIILDMSKKIADNLSADLKLKIDFKPALDFNTLDQRILKDFFQVKNKNVKNYLDQLLPKKMIPVIIELSEIDPELKVNSITKPQRKKLVHLLKSFELQIVDVTGFEKAIITTGGVDLFEVDPQTMKSKIIDNLFFAGEILDLDGPTGGYNLQVCWSTGYLAGESSVVE